MQGKRDRMILRYETNNFFTITTEILARLLANFYCQ